MTTTYEIRSAHGRPVFRFDNETRAKAVLANARKRVGSSLRLVKITTHEEEIAA